MSVVDSAVAALVNIVGVRNVAFEVTQRCNQDCVFCYNVWKCCDYPKAECGTKQAKEIIDRIIRDYRPQVLTLTGGEPLLRKDIVELVAYASKMRVKCNLITNGTLMTDELAWELVSGGVSVFEFTLLSADRETHNSLVGRDSFESLIEAIAAVASAGGTVATTFVAMKQNIAGWEETLELNAALGVSGILFNRFNIGGAGIDRASELLPSVEELRQTLEIADRGSKKYGISISCGVPFPPCVLDRRPYRNVHFGDCPVGTRKAYPTVDALGNVRPCNHSATVLGNLFEQSFAEILASDAARAYGRELPEDCKDCQHARSCRGGCRAAAEVCGDACGVDPCVSLLTNVGGERHELPALRTRGA